MPQTQDRDEHRQDGLLSGIFGEAGLLLRQVWRVFWKTTVLTAATLFLLWAIWHRDEFRDFSLPTLYGAAVVLGYCLFWATWLGAAAAALAAGWRLWGAWVLVPLMGSLLGAAGVVALAFMLLNRLDLRGAGVHGGGDVAALLILGGVAVLAGLGAILGGGVSTLWVVRSRRRSSRRA